MKTVWKFAMPAAQFWRVVEMDENAVCVKSSTQQNVMVAWYLVDPNAPLVKRHFTTRATGEVVDSSLVYQDTIFQGGLVWHLYEDPAAKGEGKIEGRDYG